MGRIEKWFEDRPNSPWTRDALTRIAYQYVKSGDRAVLRQIKPPKTGVVPWWLLPDAIAPPNVLSETDRRALHILAALGLFDQIGMWLSKYMAGERPEEDYLNIVAADLMTAGFGNMPMRILAPWIMKLANQGRPTSAGRYVISSSDKELRALAREAGARTYGCCALIDFMLDFAPSRFSVILDELLRPEQMIQFQGICRRLLERGNGAYDRSVFAAFKVARSTHNKFLAGIELAKHDLKAYGREALQAAQASLAGLEIHNRHDIVCEWMINTFGRQVVPEIAEYMRRTRNTTGHAKQVIIPHCVNALGKEALPIVLAGLDAGGKDTPFVALMHLIEIGDAGHQSLIRDRIEAGLDQQEAGWVIRYIGLAAKWNPSAVSGTLWALVECNSKPVREAAARAVGRMGDDATQRAATLLQHRKADMRMAAVVVLAASNTVPALQLMEDRLDIEDTDDVREAILAALQEAWEAAGKTLTRSDVESRAQRSAARIKWPPAKWLSGLALPSINYTSGGPLPEHMVRYLLWRQCGGQEIKPLYELKPLYTLIDRATSGDFALALLNEYVASGADAKDKWALVSAALLGDDRIVPVLTSQIQDWVDHGRGKLAEYAVQALALLARNSTRLCGCSGSCSCNTQGSRRLLTEDRQPLS